MRFLRIPILFNILAALFVPTSVLAQPMLPAMPVQGSAPGVDCSLPESDAEALIILNNETRGYWWDHTDLTVVVQAHPKAKAAYLAAVRGAIADWNEVLVRCFDGRITLTEVPATTKNQRQTADIVLHYVPKAGGMAFAGYALCNRNKCNNVLVSSDLPPGHSPTPYTPEYLGWVTLHELGHALGVGHATNLYETTDLMGYGWPDLGNPVLSDCDVDAIAFVFAWALEGSQPHPPAQGPYDCSWD